MRQEILNKYSIPVPRYTSYPPANFFNESYTAKDYERDIAESNDKQPQHISIYIHIPYCFQMCYYCGCNAIQLKDKEEVNGYIDALKKELRMVLPMLASNRKISQIHYGGGTPTSQPISVIKELNELILAEFDCIENPEIAIECHPGYMDESYWKTLPEIGFNRVSIGIQDFDEKVLKASHRKISRLNIEDITQWLKEKNITFNLDFIYGLPLQTKESFTRSIEKAIALKPNRVVTFSYAHVPWVNPLQKKLEEIGLPAMQEKEHIFNSASHLLNQAGYKSIGLDHFVLPEDELYIASKEKNLHRNFQGYCTRRTTGQVYAFGVTGISQLSGSYAQNTKDIETYITQINRGKFPTFKGYRLRPEEQITREVISSLMCNNIIRWKDIADIHNISSDDVKRAVNYNENILREFCDDGLIEFDKEYIYILPDATPFVRNVAASLDKLMIGSNKQYSKPI